MTGTSLIEPTPSKLFATSLAKKLACETMCLGPAPSVVPVAGATKIACCPMSLQLELVNCMSLGPLSRPVVPVSYTHLTLPTNREV